MGWFDKSGELRVDPDGRYVEDRKVQPVKTYKMTPEELEKYITVSYKKPAVAGIMVQKRREKNVMSIEEQKDEKVEKIENVATKKVPTKRLSKEIIAEEFKSGMTALQIAEKHNKKEYWVYGEMVKHGLVEKRTKPPMTSRKKKTDIVDEKLKAEPSLANKFYIASGYENRVQVKRLSNLLEKMGFKNAYDWTDIEENLQEVPTKELEGIKQANIIVVALPGAYETHVELGAALALDKKVILWCDFLKKNDCLYYNHPSVRIVYDALAFIDTILDTKGATKDEN